MTRTPSWIILGLLLTLACAGGAGGPDDVAKTPDAGAIPAQDLSGIDGSAVAAPDDEQILAARLAAVEADPSSAQAHRQLGIVLHRLARRREAVEQFEITVALEPTERHLLDLALAYSSTGRFDDASATYQRILGEDPRHSIALHNLGNIELSNGRHDQAIDYYQRALEARPRYVMAQFHLADALREAERFKEAYRAYEQVLQLEPSNPEELELFDDALYQIGALDLQMGATERAAQMLTELVQANPEHPKAHYALAQALQQLGRSEQAEREFETHLRLLEEVDARAPVASRD